MPRHLFIDCGGVMKISFLPKSIAILIGLGLVVLAFGSLFLRSETGRHWAQSEAISWIEREYGVSIQYQSLTIAETALGWDLTFGRILWKLQPSTPDPNQDAPGQPIEELRLSINPISLFLKTQPITALSVKGLIVRPTLSANGIQLRGAGWNLDQHMLSRFRLAPSEGGHAWPTIRVEDVLVEIENTESKESSIDRGPTKVQMTGEWSSAKGLRDITIVSPRINLVRLGEQLQQLGTLLGVPGMVSVSSEVLSVLEAGSISDLQIHCKELMDCVGLTNLKNLQWKEKNYLPGLRELSARLEFNGKHFELIVPHADRTLSWSKVYSHPIAINFFGTRIKGTYKDETITLEMPQTRIDWNRLPVEAQAQLKIPIENPAKTRLQLRLRNPAARWDQVNLVLPNRILGPDLMAWLSQALSKGQTHNLIAELDGPILEFPFAAKGSGIFAIDADFSDMQLAYLEHWPMLKKCQGHVQIKNAKLGIDKLSCESAGLKIGRGKVDLPDFSAANPRLLLDLEVQGNLNASLEFLAQSPLHAIKQVIETLGIEAPSQQTKIALMIPLSHHGTELALRLKGESLIPQAQLVLPRQLLSGTLRQFKLGFDQDGLESITADLEQSNQKSKLVVKRDSSGTFLDLSLKTPAMATGLEAALRLSPAQSPQRIEGRLSGLSLQQGAAQLEVDSLVWQGVDHAVQLKGKAIVQDFGKISSMLGLGDDFEGGHGKISFEFSLPGNLSLISPSTLSGALNFDLAEGRIHKLSGTPMALINMANLKLFGIDSRTLKYSFLRGSLLFTRGSLSTEEASIGLGALEIQAKGLIDYPNDSMNVELTIIPDLGSPASSLAIGIWNPLLGLGLYGYSKIQNKASDSRLNRLASQTYRMKGSIKKPDMSLIRILHLKEVVPWTNSKDKKGA